MLLLWSRLAALALAARVGPVSASPLKARDNGLSIAPASRIEQVTNFNKRNISVPPTFDSIQSYGIAQRSIKDNMK